jgi:hypothetical protein
MIDGEAISVGEAASNESKQLEQRDDHRSIPENPPFGCVEREWITKSLGFIRCLTFDNTWGPRGNLRDRRRDDEGLYLNRLRHEGLEASRNSGCPLSRQGIP